MPGTDGTTHLQNHPGEQPKETPDAVLALVIGRNANVDVPHGGVGVAESNSGDVSEGSFLDGLVIGPGVGKDEEAGLAEGSLELVGEGAGSVAAGNSMSTGVLSKLKDSCLAVRPGRLDNHVLWILYRNYNPSCQLQLFPRFTQVYYVDSWPSPLLLVLFKDLINEFTLGNLRLRRSINL